MNVSEIELFRKACGFDRPLVLERRHSERAEAGLDIHEFEQPFVLVGRDPRTDLYLEGDDVSRLHAYFHAVGNRLFCLDLGSRTGIASAAGPGRLDRVWLDSDQFINIGGHEIRRIGCEDGDWDAGLIEEARDTRSTEPDEAPRLSRSALELPIRTGGVETLWSIPKAVTLIGRAEGCDMTLSDDSVSRFHASFVRTPGGLWVVDLRSREGVFVGGTRVRWAWLDDGDTIRIGRFAFIVRYLDAPRGLGRQDVPLSAGAMPVDAPAPAATSRPLGRSLAVRPISAPGPLAATPPILEHASLTASIVGVESTLAWQSPFQAGPMPPAMWRQQMQLMESFHNDMILMVQMFVAMHKEHLAAVRMELDRVEQLTRELNGLQEKLARALPAEEGEPSAPDSEPPRRVRAGSGRVEAEAVTTGKAPRAATPEARGSRASGVAESRPNGAPDPSDAPKDASQGDRGPMPSSDPVETHGMVTERIATLQRERQTYWRLIISQISKRGG